MLREGNTIEWFKFCARCSLRSAAILSVFLPGSRLLLKLLEFPEFVAARATLITPKTQKLSGSGLIPWHSTSQQTVSVTC